jgi:hypothetical protein
LDLAHEESQGGAFGKAASSATILMVPFWQHGQRERSTPVIFKSSSLADSTGQWGKAAEIEELAPSPQSLFFTAVGQKTEVADAHKALRENVEQEAADQFAVY